MAEPGKILFVADAHLPPTIEAVDELLGYVEARTDGAKGIYLLGDIFSHLIGLPNFRSRGNAEERFFDGLDRFAARGLDVGYVGGNRDYFLDVLARSHPRVTFTESSLDVNPFGVRVHLIHGDTINSSDRQYLRWRSASRSRAARLACSLLPGGLARRLASKLERDLASTNHAYRIAFPEDECRRYGAAAAARGIKLVLLGHFHDPRTVACDGTTIHVLPDWLSRRAHAELHQDGTFVLEAR